MPLHSGLFGALLLDSFDADDIVLFMTQLAGGEINERLGVEGVAKITNLEEQAFK